MKPFKYTMESILGYRRDIEEQEKQKMLEIQNEYHTQKSILSDLNEKVQKANSSLHGKKIKSIVELKNNQQYIHFLREKIAIQRQLTVETKKQLDGKRQELLQAQRDRKIMEKHKEKSLEKYKIEFNKYEQNVIDELALYAHMRK